MSKKLFCIRHGTSEHNVRFYEIGELAFNEKEDTELLAKGIEEARHLGDNWKEIDNIELVLVSPLSRTLETATQIFKNKKVPMIALDCLIEYPQHSELCNKRKAKKDIVDKYPHVNFDRIANDLYWNGDEEESYETLKERVKFAKQWIMMRSEKKIAIVSHSSYLAQFLNGEIIDKNDQLKHCYPYELKLYYE
tara:strand:+ start:336 stop:914 length:579 start_codon:yes stop_codon:yes gene_type:complete